MLKGYVVFLDDGDVMNDNAVRGREWRQYLGEFFTPRYGGTAEIWGQANWKVAVESPLWEGFSERNFGSRTVTFAEYEQAYAKEWVHGMFGYVGLPLPSQSECVEILREAGAYVTPRVRSAYPGAIEAIRELHARGYELHTASNEVSFELHGYLSGMGVRECFGKLYGPDLIDTFKESPLYYQRMFADAGIEPSRAVAVEDKPSILHWAAQVGAKTIQVGSRPTTNYQPDFQIARLADLPALLEQNPPG